jgi:hypothetical protein
VSEDDDIIEFFCCFEAQAFLFAPQQASSKFSLLSLLWPFVVKRGHH